MLWLVAVLTAVAILAILRGLYMLLMADVVVDLDTRLLPGTHPLPAEEEENVSWWSRWARRLAITRALDEQLDRANVKLTGGEWLTIWIALTSVAFLLGLLVSGNLVGAVGIAVIGFLLPKMWLDRRVAKRRQMFQDQLVDVLRLITNALQAGHGLLQAMKVVSEEMPSPSNEEFGRVVMEVGLGYSLVDALQHLVRRVENDDLEMVVTAIEINMEVGGSLSEILANVSNTIEERVRLKGEINSLTAQQRMSAYLISGMPFILAIILTILNPSYMLGLFTPQWIWLPAIGVVMIVMGNLVMRRMMRIEV